MRNTATAFVLSFLLLTGAAYAQSFAPSTGTFPNGNAKLPGNAGSAFQEKTGDFWASLIGSTNGYCIGTDCITAWSQVGGATSCQLNLLIKEFPQGGQTGTAGDACMSKLTQAEVDAGWTVINFDNCLSVRDRDCNGPSHCTFAQVACTGAISTGPGVVTFPSPPPTFGGGGK